MGLKINDIGGIDLDIENDFVRHWSSSQNRIKIHKKLTRQTLKAFRFSEHSHHTDSAIFTMDDDILPIAYVIDICMQQKNSLTRNPRILGPTGSGKTSVSAIQDKELDH